MCGPEKGAPCMRYDFGYGGSMWMELVTSKHCLEGMIFWSSPLFYFKSILDTLLRKWTTSYQKVAYQLLKELDRKLNSRNFAYSSLNTTFVTVDFPQTS